MGNETVLRNARIVLADDVVLGSLKLVDGRIADISAGAASTGEDMEGDFLTPGLVELHTDHLEGHYAPRPKVRWNPIAAVQAHDAQIAASGITTVFDALRIGFDDDAETGIDDMRKLSSAIAEGRAAGACAPTISCICAARFQHPIAFRPLKNSATSRWSGWCP